MKIEEAQRLGVVCGLKTLAECYSNVKIHALNLFSYTEIDEEVKELQDEIMALPEYPNDWGSIVTPQSIVDDENAKMEAQFEQEHPDEVW